MKTKTILFCVRMYCTRFMSCSQHLWHFFFIVFCSLCNARENIYYSYHLKNVFLIILSYFIIFFFDVFFLFNSKSTIKFAIFCLFFAINEPYKQTTNKTLILHRMIIIILAHSSCMWRKRERTELY